MFTTSRRSFTSVVIVSISFAIGTVYTMRSSGSGGNLMLSFATMTVPGPISATSAAAVSGFITTRISWPPRRAIHPSLLARIVNQVGSPAMFEGNRFFPLTGMPIWKMARSRTLFAVWLPEPLTVATWMLKSLTTVRMGKERYEPLWRGSSSTRAPRAVVSRAERPCLDPPPRCLIVPAMPDLKSALEPTPLVLATAQRWLAPVQERLGHDFLSAYITGGALNE